MQPLRLTLQFPSKAASAQLGIQSCHRGSKALTVARAAGVKHGEETRGLLQAVTTFAHI